MFKKILACFFSVLTFSSFFASNAKALTVDPLIPEFSPDSKIEFNTPADENTFDVTFLAKNQNLTYNTTITNTNADVIEITNIEITTPGYDFLEYSFTGLSVGDKLDAGASQEIAINLSSNSNNTRTIEENFRLSIHYHTLKTTPDPTHPDPTEPEPEPELPVPDTGANSINESNTAKSNSSIIYSVIIVVFSGLLLFVLIKNRRVKNGYAIIGVLSFAITFLTLTNIAIAEKDEVLTITGKVRFTNIYTVSIDPGNGLYNGEPGIHTIEVRDGQETEINNPTYDTYRFTGWTTEPNTTLVPTQNHSDILTVDKDYNLTANWEEIYYNLTIDPNGGVYNGSTETQITPYRVGATATILAVSKEGANYQNWTKEVTDPETGEISTETYTGDSLAIIGDTTLTANYEDIYFDVTVDPNGGKFNDSTSVYTDRIKYGSDLDLSSIERDDHDLIDWTMNTSDSLPAATESIQIYSDTNLVANWEAVVYHTVTINPDGGSYNNSTEPTVERNIRHGRTFTLGEITKDGYALDYYEVVSGTVDTASEGRLTANSFNVVDDVVLTAHWARIVARIERTGKLYGSIMAAHNEAIADDIITLLVDTEEVVTNEKTVTLDLNQHTVTGSLTNTDNGNITIINGEINNPSGAAVTNNGTLTIGIDDYNDDGAANILNDNVRLIGTTAGIMQTNDTYKFYYYDGYLEGDLGLVGGYDGSPSYRNTFDGVVVHYYPFVSHVEQGSRKYQHVELESSDRAVSKTSVHGDIYYYNLQDNINTSIETGYKIYAVRDFDASYTITIPENSSITFDITGYNVRIMDTFTNNGTLTIIDGNTTENSETGELNHAGTFTAKKSILNNGTLELSNAATVGAIDSYGTLRTRGADITYSDTILQTREGAVYDFDDKTVFHSESECVIQNNLSNFVWTNASIKSKFSCICNSSNMTTTIESGNLSTDYGNVLSRGNFIINGGTISSNYGNVTVSASQITMNGGTIIAGGDIAINGSSFLMTGGLIQSENTGIYNTNSTLLGGKIIAKTGFSTYDNQSLIFGSDDGAVSTSSPEIVASEYAVRSDYQIEFYDGVIHGKIEALKARSDDKEYPENGLLIPDGYAYHFENSEEFGESFWLESVVIPNFLEIDGTEYNSLSSAYNAVGDEPTTIKVIADHTILSALPESPTDKTITLDLNGHKLSYTQTLINNSNLIITDSSSEKTGELNNINETPDDEYGSSTTKFIIQNNGTLTVNSGKLNRSHGIGIVNTQNAVFTLNDGEINATVGIKSNVGATTTINGGAIHSSSEPILTSGTSTNNSRATVNITGGLLESNYAGIYGNKYTDINITGGQIKTRRLSGMTGNIAYGINGCGTTIINAGNENVVIDVYNEVGNTIGLYCTESSNTELISGKIQVESKTNATGVETNIFKLRGGIIDTSSTSQNSSNLSIGIQVANNNITIESGTIHSNATNGSVAYGVNGTRYNTVFTVTIGDSTTAVSITNPEITSSHYALFGGKYNYYDGVLRGNVLAYDNSVNFVNMPNLKRIHKESSDEYAENAWLEDLPNFLEVNGVGYNTFNNAFNAVSSGGTIKVIDDAEITATLPTSPTNKSLTIDLNNHTITHTDTIKNQSTSMTITDSSTEGGGKLNYIGTSTAIESYTTLYFRGGTLQSAGTKAINNNGSKLTNAYAKNRLYITGGTITCTKGDASCISSRGKSSSRLSEIYIQGGQISSPNYGISGDYTTMNITNGHITGNGYGLSVGTYSTATINRADNEPVIRSNRYGIRAHENSTVTLTSGKVEVEGTSGQLYGVYSQGTFTMNGGSISVTQNGTGIGIYNNTNKAFTLNNGTIYVSTNYSRGIIGPVTMNNGSINVLGRDAAFGSLDSWSTTTACINRTIKGGTIYATADNTDEGHAVYSNSSCSTTTIGNDDGEVSTVSPEIMGSNYGLKNGSIVMYDGVVKGGTNVQNSLTSITPASGYTLYTEDGLGIDGHGYIRGLEIGYLVTAGTVARIGDTEYTSLNDAVSAAGAEDIIDLVSDSPYSLVIPNTKDITIRLNGNKLAANGVIANNGKLTLHNNESNGDATFTKSDSTYFITNNSGAELTLKDTNFNIGGGIKNNGTLLLDNVSITTSETAIENSGTVNITNELRMTAVAKDDYLIINNGTFNLTGANLNGGLVSNSITGNLVINDSTLSKSGSYTEDLVINAGTLEVHNSTISLYNTISINAGNSHAITIQNTGTMTVTDGSVISYNTTGYNNTRDILVRGMTIFNDEGGVLNLTSNSRVTVGSDPSDTWWYKHYAIYSEQNTTISIDSAEVIADVNSGTARSISTDGRLTMPTGSVSANSRHNPNNDEVVVYGISGGLGAEIILGTPEPSDSPNYGQGTADVSTTSPSIIAIGQNASAYGVSSSSLYYYDGKITAQTSPLKDSPAGVEYLYEPMEYTDDNGYKYVILKWMREQP